MKAQEVTRCPTCNGRLQATVALYVNLQKVTVHPDSERGARLVPHGLSIDEQDGWEAWIDVDHRLLINNIYCENDHNLGEALFPGPPL